MKTDSEDQTVVHWPPSRFFWALVSFPGKVGESGETPPGLLMDALEDLPVEVPSSNFEEQLHSVFVRVNPEQAILCIALSDSLTEFHENTEVMRLCPTQLPECLTSAFPSADAEKFNLLIGRHLSGLVRRHADKRRTEWCILLVVGAMLLVLGFERLATQERRQASKVALATSVLVTDLGIEESLAPIQKTALLQEMIHRKKALEAACNRLPRSVRHTFESTVVMWPEGTNPTRLSFDQSSILAVVNLRNSMDYSVYVEPPGFKLSEPQLMQSSNGVIATLTFNSSPPGE